MGDIMKANDAEMARLASRVAGRARDAFPEVDFEAAANAVAGTEFAEVLRAVSDALKRAGGGAAERIEGISTFVQQSSGALTGQDAVNRSRVSRVGGGKPMRPTISQLRGWDVANLDAAAKAIEDASKNLDLNIDGVVRDLDSAETYWKGKSFNAAYNQASNEQSATNRLSFAITNVADAVRGGHSALTAAHDKVMALVNEATSKGLQVADDGTVTAPEGKKDLQAEARRLTDAIRQALKALEEADRTSSNDLRKASETVDQEHKSASTQPAAFMPASAGGGAASGSMNGGGFGGSSGGGGYGGGSGSGGGGGHSSGGGGTPDGTYSNTGAPSLRPSGPSVFMNLDAGQMDVARKIIEEGLRRGLPPEAIQIALATALTESGLRSLANSSVADSLLIPNDGVGQDHDSVGPFQQRQSWGATADLMDPTKSAGKFYDALVKVNGWQDMSVAQAAQSVQRSAFPDAYAKYEQQAAQIFSQVTGR